MTTSSDTHTTTSVQTLIDRIRDDGVRAAQTQADALVQQARQQAAEIIGKANAESDSLRERTFEDIIVQQRNAAAELQTASRDTIITLKTNVISAFEHYIKRLVSAATLDPKTLRQLILVLAGHAVDNFIHDKSIQVYLSSQLCGKDSVSPNEQEQMSTKIASVLLGLSADMLREGIELITDEDIQGGAYVKLVDEDLAIDLSDQAISQLLMNYLSPHFKALIEGVE